MGRQQSKMYSPRPRNPAAKPSTSWEEKVRALDAESSDDDYDVGDTGGFSTHDREPQELKLDVVASRPERMLRDPRNRLALCALSSANAHQVLKTRSVAAEDQQVFNVKIPFEGAPMTNQRRSGRCWLFASTNVFRIALMNKYKLDAFELSQAYLFYWDKLEKANWYLEQMIDTAGLPLDDRVIHSLQADIVSDGGQWDMVYNLVNKYGLVPQSLYPDSWNAENSGVVNSVLKNKLREFGLKLRRSCGCGKGGITAANPATSSSSGGGPLKAQKEKMMEEVQRILTLLLGVPPTPNDEFTWQYNDRDGKAHEVKTTPREFARDIASSSSSLASFNANGGSVPRINSTVIDGMVSLVHDPRHEPLSLLTVSRLGNVVGGRPIRYINVDMGRLKAACVAMLREGLPVFFGSDVGQFSDSASGIMDLGVVDWQAGLGTSLLGSSKAQRLQTGESQMTHAMVLTAVHIDEETKQPVRWRVQNSWGTTSGSKGWFVMSDEWMDEFVYQAVVDARLCGREVREVLDQKPVVLPLWDPMGSLA